MEPKVNYTVVGVFVVGLMVVGLLIVLWLSSRTQKHYDHYTIYMHEAVTGLSEKAPVEFNGVEVGYVQSISLNPNNPQQVVLLVAIEQGVPITRSTVAKLKSQGITGLRHIGLFAKTTHAALLKVKKGERYPVIPSEPSLLLQLDKVFTGVAKNIESVTKDFHALFNEKNIKMMQASLESMEKFTYVLSSNSQQCDRSRSPQIPGCPYSTQYIAFTLRCFIRG